MIERDLFGTVRLVSNWGPMGTPGWELVAAFPTEAEAGESWRPSPRRSADKAIGICEVTPADQIPHGVLVVAMEEIKDQPVSRPRNPCSIPEERIRGTVS
jgi:hypothetical protein